MAYLLLDCAGKSLILLPLDDMHKMLNGISVLFDGLLVLLLIVKGKCLRGVNKTVEQALVT